MSWPTTHDMTGTKEYRAWVQIKRRCFNIRSKDYARYGAKGISMDPEYADSFKEWFREVGPAPSPAHSVDRVDGTKGYVKGNMHWATIGEQAVNRKTGYIVTIHGVVYDSFTSAGAALGVSKTTIRKKCQGYSDKRWRGYTYPPVEGYSYERRYN